MTTITCSDNLELQRYLINQSALSLCTNLFSRFCIRKKNKSRGPPRALPNAFKANGLCPIEYLCYRGTRKSPPLCWRKMVADGTLDFANALGKRSQILFHNSRQDLH